MTAAQSHNADVLEVTAFEAMQGHKIALKLSLRTRTVVENSITDTRTIYSLYTMTCLRRLTLCDNRLHW